MKRDPLISAYSFTDCECGQRHGKYWSTPECSLHDAHFAHRRLPITKRPRGCNCRSCKEAAAPSSQKVGERTVEDVA